MTEWVRNQRGHPPKPGPWHLRKRRVDRSFPASQQAECGFYPDHRLAGSGGARGRREGWPEDGEKVCPKCRRLAEAREAG